MSEFLVPSKEFEDINDSVRSYSHNLRQFSDAYDLPTGLLAEPDHIVFKAIDTSEFASKVRAIKPWVEEEKVAFIELNWRFVAAARMVTPLALGYKLFNWVEIMEPKTVGVDYNGLEYAEFYYPNIDYAAILLQSRNLTVQRSFDGLHDWRWLTVPINDQGQEVRFSDTKLEEIIGQKLDDETARLI